MGGYNFVYNRVSRVLSNFQSVNNGIFVLQSGKNDDYLFERVHSDSGVIITNPRIKFPLISSNL